MKIFTFLLFAILIGTGCQKGNTEILKTSISQERQKYPLVHFVFLKTKKDADLKGLISEMEKTSAISVVKGFELGTFKNLGDSRAMADYDVFMQMRFANTADYQQYQRHPIHLNLKEKVKAYLAGPPVTYDYIIRLYSK